ncbi:MAG: peptide chain release factor N(5)-glutamine methyltransferase [Candidatus Moranbacteria bacterium]|nr:peptide chain release factor N(5)-glutamine methyltransferase [Candidatus Moranbacteria bacterium]
MTIGQIQEDFLSPSSKTRLTPEDFFMLLAHASGKSREYLLAHPEYELGAEAGMRARKYFARRITREPVAYITGGKEFFGLPFRVTHDTLIPRPETELLVERVIADCRLQIADCESETPKNILIADIGTGSGSIIIALAHTLGKDTGCMMHDIRYEFHAVDISKAALDIAEGNADRNGVADMITFHEGNHIEPIKKIFHEADEIILTANLPYLSESIYASASDDVKRHEPKDALLSGKDGLDHYRTLFGMMAPHALPGKNVSIFCEISPEQELLAEELARTYFPHGKIDTFPDLSGRTRVLEISLE